MELKIRALVIQSLYHFWITGSKTRAAFFQMTSKGTNEPLKQALSTYKNSPLLFPLLETAGWDNLECITGIQGLIGTFTPKNAQGRRDIFTFTNQEETESLALPGGHGQNFRVLAPIYKSMAAEGRRFAYLGNVDNLGFLPDPLAIAVLALTGASAGFDFSFKTPVDVKGGVLYTTKEGRLNCGDIGVAIRTEDIKEAESQVDTELLFNCATGVFNLKYLTENLDRLISNLPLRLSEQDKDIGKYAQVEQVTWEVLGLLENPLIFAVEKNRRFLAAKLLIESFMTSGLKLDDPRFQIPELKDLKVLATGLNQGLGNLLQGPYGMKLENLRWAPLTLEELENRFKTRGLQDLRA